ncbi:MAG: S8 family peptidase [Flavisolibacter sp.]|nr:S8 family peptidase [Flavisolibacter sp.]
MKSLLLTCIVSMSLVSWAQSTKSSAKGWHLKDLKQDGYYGISLDKAYDLVKNKKNQTVIVAIIDSGIDTTHEDLKSVLWTNPKEIPGNGKDDDGNGYVDDVHGWNFLGGKDGRNVNEDSYEVARVYHKYKDKFKDISDPAQLPKEEQYLYNMWRRAEKEIFGSENISMTDLLILQRTAKAAANSDSVLRKAMNKPNFTGKDLETFVANTEDAKKAKSFLLYLFSANNLMDMSNTELLESFNAYLSSQEKKAMAAEKTPKDYRGEIVKDNYNDINDRFYGNSDIMAADPEHGTHVAGIIGAERNNGKGIDGIADNVKIMLVRAVPDGDEHDKDVALAIRYAVDNGARVINMSFGKYYSPEKPWVDEAVRYAESKNVLLVAAAGNESYFVDTLPHYPNPVFLNDNKRATNWITVGASGDPKLGGLVASFSNVGKKDVDVFAPGVSIYSTVPTGNMYRNHDGTSMASPVVTGVAAFILSYYPNLTAQQVKYIIEESSVKPTIKAENPANGKPALLSELSKTGGVVNAYEAVKLAETINNKAPRQPAQTAPVKREKKPAPAKAF